MECTHALCVDGMQTQIVGEVGPWRPFFPTHCAFPLQRTFMSPALTHCCGVTIVFVFDDYVRMSRNERLNIPVPYIETVWKSDKEGRAEAWHAQFPPFFGTTWQI